MVLIFFSSFFFFLGMMDSGWVTIYYSLWIFLHYQPIIERIYSIDLFFSAFLLKLKCLCPSVRRFNWPTTVHNITTTPTVPPRLQLLSRYKQPPKETDRKEQKQHCWCCCAVLLNAIGLIFRHFRNIILSNGYGATSLDGLKKIIRKNL
jgi:hypothetical protein